MCLQREEAAICVFLGITTAAFYGTFIFFQSFDFSSSNAWIFRLVGNLIGYATVLIPGFICMKFIRRSNYLKKSTSKGCLWPIIRECIVGQESHYDIPLINYETNSDDESQQSLKKNVLVLLYCFGGLQASFLIWGLLQERIITQKYDDASFTDSQFLVFVNRIIGFAVATAYLTFFDKSLRTQPKPPLYKYSFCSFSNIMSSWFQYEALKFVSFPSQVLAKSSKIIPVMLMGKLISKKSYEFYEYLTALLISVGLLLFLLGSEDTVKIDDGTSTSSVMTGISGLVILASYMIFDSFTSNWQSELFHTYRISSFRMMAGVNLFSLLLTGVSLLQQGSLWSNFSFLFQHNAFAVDCLILSICSGVGQLFIYHTINKFGPVVFTIIMSIRQAFAILLSCLFFGHPVTAIGIVGVVVVFLSLFLRVYCSYRVNQLRRVGQLSSNT